MKNANKTLASKIKAVSQVLGKDGKDQISFHTMIAALAQDAVKTQMLFDQEFDEDLNRFDAVLARTPQEWVDLFLPIFPQRQFVKNFKVSSQIQLTSTRTITAGIAVKPLSIAYEIQNQTSSTRKSTLSLEVIQTPLNTNV